MSIRIRRR